MLCVPVYTSRCIDIKEIYVSHGNNDIDSKYDDDRLMDGHWYSYATKWI